MSAPSSEQPPNPSDPDPSEKAPDLLMFSLHSLLHGDLKLPASRHPQAVPLLEDPAKATTKKKSNLDLLPITQPLDPLKQELGRIKNEIWNRQLKPEQITSLFLIGARHPSWLEALSQALPGLRFVLLLEPDAGYLNYYEKNASASQIKISGGLTLHDCIVVAGDPNHRNDDEYFKDIYLLGASLLVKYQLSVAHSLCVIDKKCLSRRFADFQAPPKPTSRSTPAARAAAEYQATSPFESHPFVAATQDLLNGFGTRMSYALGTLTNNQSWGHEDIATLFDFANHLYNQRQFLHALALYLPLHKKLGMPDLARQIGACWQELGRPDISLEWLDLGQFPPEALQSIRQELLGYKQQLRDQENEILESNLAVLSRRWPEFAQAIRDAPAGEEVVVFLEGFPWLLGDNFGKDAPPKADLAVLVRPNQNYLDLPRVPQHAGVFGEQLNSLEKINDAHALIGSCAAVDFWVNVLTHPLESKIPNWKQSITFVEKDLSMFKNLLGFYQCAENLLDQDAIEWHFGPQAEEQLVTMLLERRERTMPRFSGGVSQNLAQSLKNVIRQRWEEIYESVTKNHALYTPERVSELLAKLERGDKLRIASITSQKTNVLQYVSSDLHEAFAELGHEAHLLIEDDWRDNMDSLTVAVRLAQLEPDLIVLTDHLRSEFGNLTPGTLPSITWILDELPQLSSPENIQGISETDLVLVWSESLCELYKGLGYPHCEKLCFAAAPSRYFERPDVQYEDSVAFATHLSFPDNLPELPGFMQFYEKSLDSLEHLPVGRHDNRLVLQRALDAFGAPKLNEEDQETISYRALLVNRHVDRIRVADAAIEAGIPIALYGSGWEKIPRFAPHARGVVRPGDELNRVYQKHKVTLHINHNCTLHPRVFECICSGGFILARSNGDHEYTPDGIANTLEIGKEICLFDGREDMIAKIKQALADEGWRQSFIRAARARVLKENTYTHRAAAMLEALKQQLESFLQLKATG